MARKPLIGAKIVFAAGALKSRRVCAYAVQQGCGQPWAGAHAQGLEITGHHGAGGAHVGANITQQGRASQRACRNVVGGAGQGMMVDDAVKVQALKSLAVMRLGIHHGKVGVLVCIFRLPGAHGDVQVTDHGQVVGPGHLIDTRNVHIVHLVDHNTLEGQR